MSKAPISVIAVSFVLLIVSAALLEQYPLITAAISAAKEGSFMNAVWNFDLYELIKPVGTALLNVMAGVAAGLASSRIPSLRAAINQTAGLLQNLTVSRYQNQYTGGTVPSFCRFR